MELNIIEKENKLFINFKSPDKSEFFDMLEKIKTLNGRIYNSLTKKWEIPNVEINRKKLKNWGFKLDLEKEIKKEQKEDIRKYLNKKLFEFQKDDVQFLFDKNGRALIASEMGTGKTFQAIAYLEFIKKFPVLIVCPATLKLNWESEILKWTKLNNIYIVNGRSDIIPLRSNIIIINYDIIQDYTEQIKNLNIEIMILDEFHYCKSPKIRRTKAIKKIGENIKQIIALTGTPILNKPIEIFTTLNLLRPDLFPSYFRFGIKYCNHKVKEIFLKDKKKKKIIKRKVNEFKGATNIEELHEILIKEVMIRRKKEEVLKDLPEKLISIIPLEIDNKNEYKKAENDFSSWLLEREKKVVKVEALTKIEKLKQLAVEGKLKQVEEWISNVLEETNKLVIMCTHHFTIDYLIEKFKNISVKLDGRNSQKEKNESVKKFQEDEKIKLFIGNMKAAGVGITLTAADKLAFIELGWNPSEHDQASDRIHRIGQKNSCNIYYIIAKNTIEEDIMTLIDEKRKIVDAVHDGKITDDENLLNKLLEKYYKN